jgi:hypothetical protein
MPWRVSINRDLPVKELSAWDGARAKRQIFNLAGFNTDNSKPDVAKQGFLFQNTGEPNLKGSYLFPIAVVIGGKLVVSSAGMAAAAGYLPKANLPPALRAKGREVLDMFYRKLEKLREEKPEKALYWNDSGDVIIEEILPANLQEQVNRALTY